MKEKFERINDHRSNIVRRIEGFLSMGISSFAATGARLVTFLSLAMCKSTSVREFIHEGLGFATLFNKLLM